MNKVPMPGKVHELRALLIEAVLDWPEFDEPKNSETSEVNGDELVEWFGAWRERVKEAIT